MYADILIHKFLHLVLLFYPTFADMLISIFCVLLKDCHFSDFLESYCKCLSLFFLSLFFFFGTKSVPNLQNRK